MRPLLRHFAIVLLLLGTLGIRTAHSAPLLLNGSFEIPALGIGGFTLGGGTGWSSSHTPGSFVGPGVWDDAYLSFTRIPAQDGRQVLWMPPGTSVSQNVFLSGGTSYQLELFATPARFNLLDTELLISITGMGQSTFGSFDLMAGSSSWAAHQLAFTAGTSGIYSIELFAKNTWSPEKGAAVVFLDGATLTAVPDAGFSAGMLVVGLFGILAVRKNSPRVRGTSTFGARVSGQPR